MSTDQPQKIIYNASRMELNLTRRDLRTLPDNILDTYAANTEYLDLSHNRLTDLSALYAFPQLKYLILDSNRLHEAHLRQLKQPLPHVKVLTLNKNELSDLNDSVALISHIFPNLEYLSLHGNPICPDGLELQPFAQYVSYEYEHYRSHILRSLSQLKFLDHSSVQRQFVGSVPQESTRVLTFTPKMLWAKLKAALPDNIYRPLPARPQTYTGCHSGSIRRISQADSIYTGQNSEGNRFISNNEL